MVHKTRYCALGRGAHNYILRTMSRGAQNLKKLGAEQGCATPYI